MANKKQTLSAAQKIVIEYYKAKLNLMHVLNARWAAASAVDLFQKPYSRPRRKDPPIWKHAKKLKLASGPNKLAGFHWVPEKPTGKKFLIVHGFAGNARSFEKYIHPMLHRGYDVFAYDAPGHGKSSGSRLNLISYKWALEDIIQHHGHFDAYMAHSLGGMSLMLALEQLGFQHQNNIVLIAPLIEVQRATVNFGQFLQLPNVMMAHVTREIEEKAGHPLAWFSLPRILRQHKGKVLWVHDRQDYTTPFDDMTEILAQPPTHIEFLVTEGLGHSRIYRDNQVRKKVLESL
ncbi:MAG TPA: alpha/beta fold hydrolase [Phnomibacter sp.]|nr:alpha/beta fold hydrolase [Phnomibacter sp.]